MYIDPKSLLVLKQAFVPILGNFLVNLVENMKILALSTTLLAVVVVAHPRNGMIPIECGIGQCMLIVDVVRSIAEPLNERAIAANGSVQYGMDFIYSCLLAHKLCGGRLNATIISPGFILFILSSC